MACARIVQRGTKGASSSVWFAMSLVEATDVVDGQFSYVHLYVVMISVPMLCFILYVAFQERCDLHFTWLEIATLAFWSVHVLFLFLLFTIPAAKLLEQSAEISTIAFRLYNGLMIEKQSVALISSVQFFATRVKAAPFSFTAGGFFTITRGTILTVSMF
ncbi:High-energy light unresponsive protein 1 [Toxocara canis]|uniref:High-energy light unresponsive protein 1 n=1 Tax=Toxocara canis TaxID=6265 RepID=A0A0B2V4Z4_TOXCA|nr:High-energy light unresponsive protein 1 [Toxocara canis]